MISLSIVTVNMNSGDYLEKTVNSVKELQAMVPIHHIIVDGGSSDVSGDLLSSLVAGHVTILIEADKGIYDAMNKGIRLARSEYILFLNSGDVFNDTQRLSFFLNNATDDFDVFYSDLILGTGKLSEQRVDHKFLLHNCTNHQSMLIRTSKLECGYSLQYQICSDFNWLINSLPDITFLKLNSAIAIYDIGGVSGLLTRDRRMLIWVERLKIFFRARTGLPFRCLGVVTSLLGIIVNFVSPGVMSRTK